MADEMILQGLFGDDVLTVMVPPNKQPLIDLELDEDLVQAAVDGADANRKVHIRVMISATDYREDPDYQAMKATRPDFRMESVSGRPLIHSRPAKDGE